MKKWFLVFIFFFLLLITPFFTQAEEVCDDSGVLLKGITIKKTVGNTEILDDAEIIDNQIVLNLKMFEIGDSIEYTFIVENNSDKDFLMETNNLIRENDTIIYELDSKDHNYKIPKNSEKEFTLKATYNSEVEKTLFRGGKYDASSNMALLLSDNK